MSYAVLNKYPELKKMLENKESLADCQELFQQMSTQELAELKKYIAERFGQVEQSLWKNAREKRHIEAKMAHLKEDQARVLAMMGHLRYQLQSGFKTIYLQPEKAQQKTWQVECRKGLDAAAETLNKKPARYGVLRGLNVFGLRLLGRDRAIKQARQMDYKNIRLNYRHGESMLKWLGQMLGEGETKDAI